jgi:hypothetical protein
MMLFFQRTEDVLGKTIVGAHPQNDGSSEDDLGTTIAG